MQTKDYPNYGTDTDLYYILSDHFLLGLVSSVERLLLNGYQRHFPRGKADHSLALSDKFGKE
jgi:hypothetical protein